jgi:hypothetical protein
LRVDPRTSLRGEDSPRDRRERRHLDPSERPRGGSSARDRRERSHLDPSERPRGPSRPRDEGEARVPGKKYSSYRKFSRFAKKAVSSERLDGFSKSLHVRRVLVEALLLSPGRKRSTHEKSQIDFCTFSTKKRTEVVARLERTGFLSAEFRKNFFPWTNLDRLRFSGRVWASRSRNSAAFENPSTGRKVTRL